jgi:hypothetical protein
MLSLFSEMPVISLSMRYSLDIHQNPYQYYIISLASAIVFVTSTLPDQETAGTDWKIFEIVFGSCLVLGF